MGEIKHLINITDLSVEDINHLMETADDIIAHPENYWNACAHKKLATLFFEPSTRTRLSFTAAMMELGGNVLGFDQAQSSSSAKGETVADTIVMAGCYADIIAMRHPKEGAPVVGAARSSVPIINAGDGGHFHPTQTLTDLLDVQLEPDKVRQRIINLGYPAEIAENVTPRLMIALGFINRCMGKGDPNAIKLMLEVIGEYVETIRHELPTDKGELVLAPKKKD